MWFQLAVDIWLGGNPEIVRLIIKLEIDVCVLCPTTNFLHLCFRKENKIGFSSRSFSTFHTLVDFNSLSDSENPLFNLETLTNSSKKKDENSLQNN